VATASTPVTIARTTVKAAVIQSAAVASIDSTLRHPPDGY